MNEDFGPCMDCADRPAAVALTYASDGATDLICYPCLIARMADVAEQLTDKILAETVDTTPPP